MGIFRKTLSFFWNIFESATFVLAIFVVSYLFFFQPGIVHGTSSYPTWQEDDRFITERVSYQFENPRRGDFVVFVSPRNADVDFIKRIVGLPGEKIRIHNCRVYVNDSLLFEPYLPPNGCTGPESFLSEGINFPIPGESYFVLGDNRSHSSDSRDFGPILKSNIVGKVVFRYWPLERIRLIQN